MKIHDSEKGQAIVFLVLGLAVFMGFVALTIDGGMAFADRRNSQNGADASSLAGGGEAALYLENKDIEYTGWNCTSTDVLAAMQIAEDVAVSRAATNNFSIDYDPADGNGVTALCGEYDYVSYIEKYIDVTVNISSTTETSFAQLLFPNALVNKVKAITRVRPSMSYGYGHAIVALNPAACEGKNGAVFGGNGGTEITGGGVWSNGCIVGNGSAYNVMINDGDASYVSGSYGTFSDFDPAPTQAPYSLPPYAYDIQQLPDCSHPDAHHVSKLPDDFGPGLWCIDTGNLSVNASAVVLGEEVTIAVLNGNLTINGGAEVTLTSPPKDEDGPEVGGMLFYVPKGDITLNGSSDQIYQGVIYAPLGDCKINGDTVAESVTNMNTQIICWNVEVNGNAGVNIYFDEELLTEKPTSIELYR